MSSFFDSLGPVIVSDEVHHDLVDPQHELQVRDSAAGLHTGRHSREGHTGQGWVGAKQAQFDEIL